MRAEVSLKAYSLAMPTQKSGKVFVLVLTPPAQPPLVPLDEYIVDRLSPGRSVTRYSREWIIGKTQRDGDVLSGRIGFRGAEEVAEVYDDRVKDFREVAVPAGLAVQFAVDLAQLRLAVQPRGSAIKLNGLIGAFRALLSEGEHTWRVSSPGKKTTYQEWLQTVDKVLEVKLSVRKPNPHYRDTPDLEALLEQAEAEAAKVTLRSDQGLDMASPFVNQTMVHIAAGYGEATMRGSRQEVSGQSETIYNTVLGSEEQGAEVPVGEHGEVSRENLVAVLAAPTAGEIQSSPEVDHELGATSD